MYAQQALDWLAKKVVGPVLPEERVGIGIGNWSQVDGVVKGHPKAPSKRIKKSLCKYATVIEVDEYRTSQVCSKCKDGKKHKDDHKLDKANLIVKKKVRNDQGEFVTQRELGSCYHVLRCLNPGCNTFWQRDVNACRNIMEAFIYQVYGLPRPKYLERETISEKVLISAANLEEGIS